MTRTRTALVSLLVLALLAVALHSVAFSGASFTSASLNDGNAVAAGGLSHVDSKAGQVLLDAQGLRPGQSKSGSLTITGGGDFSARYSAGVASLTDTPASPSLSAALVLTIDDVTSGSAVQQWSGSVASLDTAGLGTIAPGASRAYRFTLTFPTGAADSGLQGATMALLLQITGVQQ
ncbi:MAG: hypothetical protein WCN81_09295 [Actinomycetes bacterium]